MSVDLIFASYFEIVNCLKSLTETFYYGDKMLPAEVCNLEYSKFKSIQIFWKKCVYNIVTRRHLTPYESQIKVLSYFDNIFSCVSSQMDIANYEAFSWKKKLESAHWAQGSEWDKH